MIDFIKEQSTYAGRQTYQINPQDSALFGAIKEEFQKIKEQGKRVLYEDSNFPATVSVVLRIQYVGDRWCQGVTTYYRMGEVVEVPYTIHYTDVLGVGQPNSPVSGIRIIKEGVNPFD